MTLATIFWQDRQERQPVDRTQLTVTQSIRLHGSNSDALAVLSDGQ